ncbi:MAG: ABC transporter substrate-binding protein, partial [Ilumatobacteraceae bacterium]
MQSTQPSKQRRVGRVALVATVSLAMLAAACSSDKATPAASTLAASTTTAGSAGETTTPTTESATPTTADQTSTTPSTSPALKPVPGGDLVVSGESEVANPFTPAAIQCDPYCYQRIMTFLEPIAAVGADSTVHGVLAESITPNADFSQWTIKLRSGINFTDGTPLNADAAMRNLSDTGTSLLVAKAVKDLARTPDGKLKMDKKDDLTFVMYTGQDGDPTKPIAWPNFPVSLTGQFGLIGSPKWLDAVKADPAQAVKAVGTGPFILQSYTPRDSMVVTKNPNYWQKD